MVDPVDLSGSSDFPAAAQRAQSLASTDPRYTISGRVVQMPQHEMFGDHGEAVTTWLLTGSVTPPTGSPPSPWALQALPIELWALEICALGRLSDGLFASLTGTGGLGAVAQSVGRLEAMDLALPGSLTSAEAWRAVNERLEGLHRFLIAALSPPNGAANDHAAITAGGMMQRVVGEIAVRVGTHLIGTPATGSRDELKPVRDFFTAHPGAAMAMVEDPRLWGGGPGAIQADADWGRILDPLAQRVAPVLTAIIADSSLIPVLVTHCEHNANIVIGQKLMLGTPPSTELFDVIATPERANVVASGLMAQAKRTDRAGALRTLGELGEVLATSGHIGGTMLRSAIADNLKWYGSTAAVRAFTARVDQQTMG